MFIKQVSLPELMAQIAADTTEDRFVARVFFVNSLTTYYAMIAALSDKADIVVRLSDEMFCRGADTVPDLKFLIDFLDEHKDEHILLPHLGEYLRTGEATERSSLCLHSILNRHVHSRKRVWIPIFAAKGLFQSLVGPLEEERFGNALFEIDEEPSEFSASAYAKTFASQPGIIDANGLKAWFQLWDNEKIRAGMSFATRQIKQLSPSGGDYALSIVTDPFSYIGSSLKETNSKLKKELGTDEQWASLVPHVPEANGTLEQLITIGLNLVNFNPFQILGTWNTLDSNKKWLFHLWYALGLNQKSDYISYAVSGESSADTVPFSLECAILSCTENTHFDEWLVQREEALHALGLTKISEEFWSKYDCLPDAKIKMKLLTGETHEERTKIIELLSQALSEGTAPDHFKTVLKEKYPDLAFYLSEPAHLDPELSGYIHQYKISKIANRFTLSFSSLAGRINPYEHKTRGQILFDLKGSCDAYFLWIDGMGIEWIDMLLAKIKQHNSALVNPSVCIGTAVLPTVTDVNMKKADSDTISEKKFDALDSLSHIKDKSDCHYPSIIAKQFDMIDGIAYIVCQSAMRNPGKDIIVTADHGMSRMAAMGFHQTGGIDAPPSATVCNHGRYCEMPSENNMPSISNTVKEGSVIAFKTHNHFTSSGYAPGEIHGGASPEELLVPIIHFKKLGKTKAKASLIASYTLASPDVYLNRDGMAALSIVTTGTVNSVTVEINGRQLQAQATDSNNWSVSIPGLALDQSYTVRIYLNNIFTSEQETIHVKRKGMVVDDDL